MVKWHQLSDKSIRESLHRMALRASFAGPFHIVVFSIMMWAQPELRTENPWIFALFGVVVFTTLSRIVLWKASEKVLARPRGRALWRSLFGSLSVALGLAWGLSEAMTFSFYGDKMIFLVVVCCVVGLCAASVSAYSFDFTVNAVFQVVIQLPTMIALALHGGGPYWALAVFMGMYMLFMIGMAKHLQVNQIALLDNQETIERQKNSLEAAHSALQKNHELIRTMLESIEEAFLIFDLEGVCLNEGSIKAREFFGVDPKGKKLFDILRIPEDKRQNIESWFYIIRADQFDFHETAARGPKLYVCENGKRTFSLNYQPMRGPNDELHAIVLTAVDVTRELAAQEAEKAAQERSEMILRVSENVNGFRGFLRHFEGALEMLRETSPKNLADVRRELHTLKGVSAIFGARSLSREVHGVELELRKYEAKTVESVPLLTTAVPAGEYLANVNRLHRQYDNWKQREMGILVQLGVFEDEKVVISKRRLSSVEKELGGEKAEVFRSVLDKLMASEFGEQLKDFSHHLEQVAVKLGKQVEFRVEWESEPVFSRPEAYLEVVRSMVHLFNNAVDHGIESPDERRAKGKSAKGFISVRYGWVSQDGKEWLRVAVQDDGRGIDVKRLREKAAAAGRPLDKKSDLEVMQTVFDEGISTRDTVTEVSGQGVGMGALRAAVLKMKGKVSIVKSDSNGTVFEILLPDVANAKGQSVQAASA